jgi:hypothetical protein
LSELQITRVVAQPVGDRATEVRVPMRDGVSLAADLYVPDGVEQAPTILVRLPYDKNSRYVFFDKIAARFTARGYAVLVQDVRGKFRSEGVTEPFAHEVSDGYDSIDWIVAQPWSDGDVAMFGDSYYGFTQWAAVASEHPALKAIVPRVTSMSLGGGTQGLGGFGEPVPWLEGAYYLATHWVGRDTYDYMPDLTRRPLIEPFNEVFEAVGERSIAFDAQIPEGEPGSPYPGAHPLDTRPIPVLHCIGWFDNLATPHMNDYLEMVGRPGWAELQHLDVGSFDHENYALELAPIAEGDDHDSDDDALERMLDVYANPALDFFDVFVRGTRDAASLPKVRWHLGHVGWRTATRWPPPGTATRSADLIGLERATGPAPGGALAPTGTAGDSEAVSWDFDPGDLVISAVVNSFAFLYDYPDERATGDRADVLTFTAAPVTAPADLAGPVELQATVVSTAPSADYFAKLLDVAPDGSAHMIVRGQVTVPEATTASRIHINLGHTGYRLRPGHALRLHLACSDFPQFVPNSGTEENRWTTAAPQPSRQTLRISPGDPARLTYTVIEEAA